MIETARLRLRPRRVEDAEALHPAFADFDVMQYWSDAPHTDIEETRAAITMTDPAWRGWTITLKGDGTAIGLAAAGEKRQGNVSEIGYMLLRSHWGGGYATEAVTGLIDQLFAEGQRRVIGDTDPDNAPSRALLEKLGFKLEGYLRAEWKTHLGVRDTTLYGLLKDEWEARKA